jgi:hypothetical protein
VTFHRVTGRAVTGRAVTGDAVTGGAVTGDAVTGGAVTGDAVTGDAVAGGAVTDGAVRGGPATPEDRPGPLLLASDLDRTLIYSAAALGLTMPDAQAPRLLCVEVYEGRPLSYMTETAARLMAELARAGDPAATRTPAGAYGPGRAVLVPVTTRTREQYQRLQLPGGPARYAVCANGGHLLVNGELDQDWHAHVRRRLAECAPLPEISDHLSATARTGDWLLKERTADGLFAYLVVDRDRLPGTWLKELAEWAEPRGWTVSLQGRKVYVVPRTLTKSAALAEVVRRTGATTSYAAGDSLLDADLLLAADAGWRPAHGELAESGWAAPHITALPERGVAAGERILREMRAVVAGRPGPAGGPGPGELGEAKTAAGD